MALNLEHLMNEYGFDLQSPPTKRLNDLGMLFHELGHMLDFVARKQTHRLVGTLVLPFDRDSNTFKREVAAEGFAALLYQRFVPKQPHRLGMIRLNTIAILHSEENPEHFIEQANLHALKHASVFDTYLNTLRGLACPTPSS